MVDDAVSERVMLSAQIVWWQWKINDVLLFTEHDNSMEEPKLLENYMKPDTLKIEEREQV